MCSKWVEMDEKIEHYQRLSSRITDQPTLDGIEELIQPRRPCFTPSKNRKPASGGLQSTEMLSGSSIRNANIIIGDVASWRAIGAGQLAGVSCGPAEPHSLQMYFSDRPQRLQRNVMKSGLVSRTSCAATTIRVPQPRHAGSSPVSKG
jgi:hypothetical protein